METNSQDSVKNCFIEQENDDTTNEFFQIQDFTTVTPIEQLGRQISHILFKWKDTHKFDFLHGILYEKPICLKENFISDMSGIRFELHYFKSHILPEKTTHTHGTHSNHTIQFDGGKSGALHRWFGTYEYLTLIILHRTYDFPRPQGNGLLDAMILACHEVHMYIPCFVLLSVGEREHYIGQLFKPALQNKDELLSIEYETDSDIIIPNYMLSCSKFFYRQVFLNHFCLKIGIPESLIFQYGTVIIGCRFIYYLDEFPYLKPSFWDIYQSLDSLYNLNQTTFLLHDNRVVDPITQLHLFCTWHPTHITLDKFDLPLDPWDSEQCSWSLRAVGLDDETAYFTNKTGNISFLCRKLLSYIVQFQTIQDTTIFSSDNLKGLRNQSIDDCKEKTSHNITNETSQVEFFTEQLNQTKPLNKLSYVSQLHIVKHIGQHLDHALESALLPTTYELQYYVNYLFNKSLKSETWSSVPGINQEDNASVVESNICSFEWRLITVLTQLKTFKGIQILWKEIVKELRYHWTNKLLIQQLTSSIPQLTQGHPKITDPPILQKLKLLNCCIQQQQVIRQLNQTTLSCSANVLPVFPPFDLMTCQLIDINQLSNQPLNNYKLLMSLMEIYLRRIIPSSTIPSSAETLKMCKKWCKEQFDQTQSYTVCLTDIVAEFQLNNNLYQSDDDTIWDMCWNHVITRDEHSTFLCEDLFSGILEAEMALHSLETLTPLEVCQDGFHIFIKLLLDRFDLNPSQLDCVNTNLLNLISTLDVPWKRLNRGWSIGNGAFMTWDIFTIALKRLKINSFNELKSNDTLTNQFTLQEAARLIQRRIERLELSVMFGVSLEQKLKFADKCLLESLIDGIYSSKESYLKTEDEKNICLNLFGVKGNTSRDTTLSPLPLIPFNSEYLFGYIPNDTTKQLPLLCHSSLKSFHRGYFSVMPQEFRVAIVSQTATFV